MKRFLPIFIFLLLCAHAPLAQEIFVRSRSIFTLKSIRYDSLYMSDGPEEWRYRPWFDKLGRLSVIFADGQKWYFDNSLEKITKTTFNREPYFSSKWKMESTQISGYWMYGKLLVTRIIERDVEISVPHPDKEDAILAWGRLLLVGDRSGSGVVYRGFLFESDGSYRVLEDAEVVPWLLGQSNAFSYSGGTLYYGKAKLTRPFEGFDDDGNLYNGPAMYPPTGGHVTFGGFTSEQGFQFDYEGNYWGIGWTADEAQNPILLYAGRDWGYREPPKKAVTTEAGLRIRLRASTDAFVLGSLAKGEAITILKTGETATIGGITAPWYRIKKADGLIGWAFGGYIKVLE